MNLRLTKPWHKTPRVMMGDAHFMSVNDVEALWLKVTVKKNAMRSYWSLTLISSLRVK